MYLSGTNGSDLLLGTSNGDTLVGLDGHDVLRGLSGNDSLDGGDGFDELDGGRGDDVLTGGGLGDWFKAAMEQTIDPSSGQVLVHGFGHDTITDFGAGDTLSIDTSGYVGGLVYDGFEIVGSNTILRFAVGTAQESSITLLNYQLTAGEFAPDASGGTLVGTIRNVASHDTLTGAAGDDWLEGHAGDDMLLGLGGHDRLLGGRGNDILYGGEDGDELWGDTGNDTLFGGDGDDEIWDQEGDDTVLAGGGNDDVFVGQGNDTISGGAGDDVFRFRMEYGTDPDTGEQDLRGFGHNVITDFTPGDLIDVDAGMYAGPIPPVQDFEIVGNDTILRFATGSDQESSITILNYHLPLDEFYGGNSHFLGVDATEAGLLTPEHVVGSDTLHDDLHGYGGNDTVDGLALDDGLWGDAGDDTLFGGEGDDWLYCGTGNDTAFGGSGDDVLLGEHGDNTLDGGTGQDELIGGTGDDTMTGGAGWDQFFLEMTEEYDPSTGTYTAFGFGHDVITDFSEGDEIYIETWAWPGSGNAFSGHEFVGSDTVLRWGVGTDQESSLTIRNHHLPEAEIDPWDDFMAFFYDPAYFASPLNVIEGTPGIDNLLGTGGDDLIRGLDGSDLLNGAAGNDTLDPGAAGPGVQNLFGGTGDDTYLIGADSGKCRISTWAEKDGWGTDRVVLEDLTLADVSVTSHDTGGPDGVQLVIAWYQNGVYGEMTMAHMGAFVETIAFADGQAFSPNQLALGPVVFNGTGSDDTLRGTVYDDHLIGGDGTDHLQAAAGDDILEPGAGGPGIQYLYGQKGNDTYRIGHDVGLARINIWAEDATSGTADTVQFTDLVADDLNAGLYQGPGADGLELRLTWDVLGVAGELQLAHQGTHVEAFEFADGAVLTAAELLV